MWSLLKDELSLMRCFLPSAGLDKQEKYKSHPGENCSFFIVRRGLVHLHGRNTVAFCGQEPMQDPVVLLHGHSQERRVFVLLFSSVCSGF